MNQYINPQAKIFIEKHIDVIDNNDWNTFWYNFYYNNSGDIALDELYILVMSLLQDAGININVESYEARKYIVKMHLEDQIDSILSSNYNKTNRWLLPTSLCKEQLHTSLGLTKDEVNELIAEIGKTYDLKYDSKLFGLWVPGVNG
jgi:hypothetical protein